MLVVIAALLAHPVWNFYWIEGHVSRRLLALVALLAGVGFYGKVVWPHPLPMLHLDSWEFYPPDTVQKPEGRIAIKAWVVNDGDDDAIVSDYGASWISPRSASEQTVDSMFDNSNQARALAASEKDHIIDTGTVMGHAKMGFSLVTKPLPQAIIQNLRHQRNTLYFAGGFLINRNGVKTERLFCIFSDTLAEGTDCPTERKPVATFY